MIIWMLLALIFSSPLPALQNPPSNPISVQEGQEFSLSVPVTLPEQATKFANIYLSLLIDSRPLPWPFCIEKASINNGKLFISGRLLRSGNYLLPLGPLWWQGTAYPLPTLSFSSLPINPPIYSANDMVAPFPEKLFVLSPEVKELQQQLNKINMTHGLFVLSAKNTCGHILIILSFVLALFPLILHVLEQLRSRKPKVEPTPEKTPKELLQEVWLDKKLGQTPWEKLLFILNRLANTSSLTAYELRNYFLKAQKSQLASAADHIEAYSYRPNNARFFIETAKLVEEGIKKK